MESRRSPALARRCGMPLARAMGSRRSPALARLRGGLRQKGERQARLMPEFSNFLENARNFQTFPIVSPSATH